MKSVLSDVLYIDKSANTAEKIEAELTKKCGSIIRWAITDVDDKKLKINVTYEKET
jgi:hypothetical protein